jgi:excisionase family DNA binding protein
VTHAAEPSVGSRPAPEQSSRVWIDLPRAAERAVVSESTIKREVRRGRIRCARVGGRKLLRFRPEWIDQWLEGSSSPEGRS